MKKRQRLSPLGASEFAAILNGEDPNAIHNALGRFIQTVRQERRIAVGGSSLDDENSSESSASDEEDTPAQKKQKFRKEEMWKEDTANYDVPFVGTSVAKGDTGRVVTGEWPTGLLKAYVQKSPRAVEFNHLLAGGPVHKTLLRRKHGRTWHTVQKLYLQAVAELITAAIPLENIKDDALSTQTIADRDRSFLQLVESLVASHFAGWCSILKEETGNGKGKAAVVGGCGQLAPYIIRIFHRLSRVNSDKARQIVRDVEQNISEHVLRFLLKGPTKEGEEYAESPRAASKIELLEWVGWLTSIPDHVILSRLCSPGARERKISPGLLFMSLKDGLVDVGSENISAAVELVVRRTKGVLLGDDSRSRKLLADVFSRDVVQNLCQLSTHAPILSSQNGFEKVLQFADKFDTPREAVGSEARRLLFTLICNPEKSPFIQSIHRNLKSAKRVRPLVLQIVQHFLKSESGEITKLVLHTLRVDPSLFTSLFQVLPFPDMKRTFSFIARVNLAANLILHGPPVEECIGKDYSLKRAIDDGKILHCFLPVNLKDTIVRKALQSGNFLVVAEVLKLIVVILKRVHSYLTSFQNDSEVALESGRLWSLLKNWIPDPYMLVSVLMKADSSHGMSSMIVANRVCVALRLLFENAPNIFHGFTFDWSKLLSKEKRFSSARTLFQLEILETLLCMLQASLLKLPPGTEAKFCYDLLHILVHTRVIKIHDSARNVVLHFLSSHLDNHDSSGRNPTIAHELSCWIDGLTADTLEDFHSVLQQALYQPFRFTLEFAKIWRDCFGNTVPPMPFSPLMIQSLLLIKKVSPQFVILYTQVATNSLLFHSSPVDLATTIKELCRQERLDGQSIYINHLERLISFHERSSGSRDFLAISEHLQSLFSEGRHPLLRLINQMCPCETSKKENMALIEGPTLLGWNDLATLIGQGSNLVAAHENERRKISKQLKSVLPALLLKPASILNICAISTQIDRLGIIFISGVSENAGRCIEQDVEAIRSFLGSLSTIPSHTSLKVIREQLYHLYFICPFLPPFLVGELLCQLTAKPKKEMFTDPIFCALTSKVLDIASKIFCKLENSYALCGKVATTIVDLWLSSGSWLGISGSEGLIHSLDSGIFEILSVNNLATSFALCELSRYDSIRVISRCIQRGENEHPKRNQILMALIEKEPTSYSPAILRVLRLCQDSIAYRFDDLLVAMKTSHLETGEDKESLLSWQQHFLKRSANMIANAEDVDICYRTFEQFGRISEEVIDLSSLLSPLSSFIKTLHSSSKTFKIRLTKLVDVTLRLCHSDHGEKAQEVASQAFLLLSDQVARLLRSYIRQSNPDDDNVESRILEAIESTITLLTSSIDFNLSYLQKGGTEALTNAVKACLRLGLRPIKGEADYLCSRCLKLVQSCVSAITSKELGQMFSSSDDFATLVFQMASTHSNFHDLLRNRSNELARSELLNLLLSCLRSGGNLIFDKEVWETLLYTFDCGMSPVDLVLRKVIVLYGKLEQEVDEPSATIERLTWGATAVTPLKPTEAFLNALEMYRLQATLCNFPLHDSVDPFTVKRKEDSKDDRYSPGFILPVALSHLELAMNTNHEDAHIDISNAHAEAVDLAQRYCERGVAALSFMAVASDCELLRRTGVVILGMLNFLAGSKRALESSTWRSRPQLAMLFDSFRRAMVIFSQEKEPSMLCPQLPSLSALFLARSSLILSRPGDDLYSNLNRVFLRIEKDHGAFQDLWRLPSFITLFCSAADDHEKLLEERLFALRLVRDGFLNELCYKPLHACHGIELIISAFDNYRLRSRQDKQDELVILMEVLERIVIFGGTRSNEHLFKRLGLMSFWRSLILARSFTDFVQTLKARNVFLSCIRTCLSTASSVLTRDDFSLAIEGLWQPLIDFILESMNCDIGFESVCISTLSALIYPSGSGGNGDVIPPISSSDGVAFSTVTRLLGAFIERKEPSFIATLCLLPLYTCDENVDEGYAVIFCVRFLRLAMHVEMPLDGVFLRIASVIERFNSSTFDRNDELLKQLVQCRCEIRPNEGILGLWRKCVSTLVKSRSEVDGYNASAFRKLTQNLIQ